MLPKKRNGVWYFPVRVEQDGLLAEFWAPIDQMPEEIQPRYRERLRRLEAEEAQKAQQLETRPDLATLPPVA